MVPINPETLFQRMCIIKQSDDELKQYLQYELEGSNSIHVVDGGYLLHRVVWSKNQSFASICSNYIQFIQRHYGINAIIVFDGYPSDTADKEYQEYRKSSSIQKKKIVSK